MSKKTDNAITLAKPVVRGDEKITQVAITDEIKQAGSLRGLEAGQRDEYGCGFGGGAADPCNFTAPQANRN